MSFLLGLTGSIGMGKSTTAQMFADEGCAIWDADAAVHRLYAEGGAAVEPMGAAFPEAIEGGAVSRDRLKAVIARDSDALQRIEAIVHPLVAADRAAFIEKAGADIVVLDIPLLYETGADAGMDAVACVTIAPEIQRQRVLDRGTMSAQAFEDIRARQMPNAEKCRRADYVIETDTLENARRQVQDVVRDIRDRLKNA
ncbi:MAG: dephospho-CoA kinase [Pseudomonadota bacterium]|uniref:dephospho-CoA kinase n=1 Tax=Roseovarius TaxID=74030 RepID=UPI0022A6CED9|nr:dephospho-CoA kinase [Roseovarius sp. EGI FJ00037]MCZ0811281.1 dephospho-CoA kinase [Roseovarius sp. EGI FJ00037]